MNLSDLKVFFRTLWRNKLYSIITVSGFALSLAFVTLLGAYIQQELSVDQFHQKKDRLYRAVNERSSNFGTLIGGELQSKYPDIECYTRLSQQNGFVENIQREKIPFNFLLADSAFFNMFSFRLLEGTPTEVLRIKNSVVLASSYARKLFGDQPALGKEVLFGKELRLIVTGVMEDMPDNTHFNKCDGIVPFLFLGDMWHWPQLFENNGNSSFGLYFLAKEGTDLPSKAPRILEDFNKDYWLYKGGYSKVFDFEPLTDVYFGGKTGQGMHGNSETLVVVLAAIAIIILILALINYNNLSVARAVFRAKEAAVKKLLGTNNGSLFRQFILESVILCFISFLLAIGCSILMQPVFNQLLEAHVEVSQYLTFVNVVGALVAVVLLGVIAGLAPAFMITRFNPVDVVKGAFRKKTKGVYSKVLICFQYTVAIALVICTLTILKQTDYMRNYDLGFDKENIVWIGNMAGGPQRDALRSEFYKIPEVVGVSFVMGSPVDGGNNYSFSYKDKPLSFQEFKVDSAFFRLLGVQVTGSGVAESKNGLWLTESGVKALELDPLPTECNPFGEGAIPVMGVVKDFHFRDLTQKVGPAWIKPLDDGEWAWSILIKISGNNQGKVYDEIKKTYSRFFEGIPFESGFMDDSIDQWYEGSERTARLIGYFSTLAIILSMMGILAMATYFIEQRVKEIGVRRVNGATIAGMLKMLIGSFMKWILLAFLIACPIAYYTMNDWLAGFAYRTELSWWLFALSGGFACIVALLMVGWQSFKTATANPVNSLKNE